MLPPRPSPRLVIAATLLCCGTAAHAQPPASPTAATPQASAAEVRRARYAIGQMERILEGAVEHGAAELRARVQALVPADLLLAETARARGFRLEGYGLFFDVEVPALSGTLPWSFHTLDRNDLDVSTALRTLRGFVQSAGGASADVQQALKRVELQMGRAATSGADDGTTAREVDALLAHPDDAYRADITAAIIDALLDHGRGVAVAPEEWLTVAARRSDDRPPTIGAETSARTVVLRLRGADLADFLAGRLTREQARRSVVVQEY